jgi:hypothetical protein
MGTITQVMASFRSVTGTLTGEIVLAAFVVGMNESVTIFFSRLPPPRTFKTPLR